MENPTAHPPQFNTIRRIHLLLALVRYARPFLILAATILSTKEVPENNLSIPPPGNVSAH